MSVLKSCWKILVLVYMIMNAKKRTTKLSHSLKQLHALKSKRSTAVTYNYFSEIKDTLTDFLDFQFQKTWATSSALINLSVNSSFLQLDKASDKQSLKRKYREIWRLDQTDSEVVVIKDVEFLSVVLLKKHSVVNNWVRRLRKTSNENLLSLIEFFETADFISLIYEYQNLVISLSRVCISSYVRFSEFYVATICSEVLNDLLYVHFELKTVYENLNCSCILLTLTENIKIDKFFSCEMLYSDLLIVFSKYRRRITE